MNDKNVNGSRPGDIVIVMDGPTGYQTVVQGDALNGWHGGPEQSESKVVMMFNIPGDVVDKTFILNALPQGTLRNWQMAGILRTIAGATRNQGN